MMRGDTPNTRRVAPPPPPARQAADQGCFYRADLLIGGLLVCVVVLALLGVCARLVVWGWPT